MVLNLIQARFPAQLSLAQQHVAALTQPAQLSKLMLDIVAAPDESAVMLLLTNNKPKPSTRRKK